jgi:predicted nucleic acid-binding protein
MSYLVDTNILLRSVQKTHVMHEGAVRAVLSLIEQGEMLYIVPQNLVEFWVVATRPIAVNGLGLSVTNVLEEIKQIKSTFTLLSDTEAIFPTWEHLVLKHEVMGKPAHDARLVAAMIVHHLTNLLTFNTDDFKRFSEICAIDPDSIS